MARKKHYTKAFPLYLTPEQDAWLQARADAQQTTKAQIVRQAINNYMQHLATKETK
jgi:predicted DNA-binding protein